MQVVNILLTGILVVLISGITFLSLCAVIASSRNQKEDHRSKKSRQRYHKERVNQDRRSNTNPQFPVTCSDGSKIYFDRRLRGERRMMMPS